MENNTPQQFDEIAKQLMENAERQQKALEQIGEQVSNGFKATQEYLAGMEQRLTLQERQTKRIAHHQRLQQQEIDGLKQIVLDLAKNRPIKRMGDTVAIPKEAAYERFADCGIGKVTANRALRDAGILKVGNDGKCTITIWHNGGCVRVMMVSTERDE